MPVLPPCMVPSTSEYHILSLPPIPNISTQAASNVPASNNAVSSNNNNSNIINNNNSSNNSNVNGTASVSNDNNGNVDNANSTAAATGDGDNDGTANGDVNRDSDSTQLITTVQCNNLLTSHESNLSTSSANGSIPCISKYPNNDRRGGFSCENA